MQEGNGMSPAPHSDSPALQALGALLEMFPEPLWLQDGEERVVCANAAAQKRHPIALNEPTGALKDATTGSAFTPPPGWDGPPLQLLRLKEAGLWKSPKDAAQEGFELFKQGLISSLAAGVAHEINNPLSGILQSAQLLSRSLNLSLDRSQKRLDTLGLSQEARHELAAYIDSQNLLKFADIIIDCGTRSSEMINNLLALARRRAFAPEVLGLSRLCEQALFFARSDGDIRRRGKWREIEPELQGPANLPDILADGPSVILALLALLRRLGLSDVTGSSSLRLGERAGRFGTVVFECPGEALGAGELASLEQPYAAQDDPDLRTLGVVKAIFCELHPGFFQLQTKAPGLLRFELGLPFARPVLPMSGP